MDKTDLNLHHMYHNQRNLLLLFPVYYKADEIVVPRLDIQDELFLQVLHIRHYTQAE